MFDRAVTGTSSSDVKLRNRSAVLMALLRYDDVSRVLLSQMIGLSSTTITNLIAELMAQGIVKEEGTVKARLGGVGRPQMALRLVADAAYAVGVQIEVGLVRIALTDLRAGLITCRQLEHAVQQPALQVLAAIADQVRGLLQAQAIDPAQVVGLGVAASGLVDPYRGINVMSPNLGWRDVPMADFFAETLGLPVFVDNNVRAMALGEALFGSAQDVRAMAFVYSRIGVGAGLVVEGQLYRGAAAGAGEIGHTTILVGNGEACHCGNTGCLETLISEPAILRAAGGHPASIEALFTAARAGDIRARDLLFDRAAYLGIALANLVNVFNPELIVLGGTFARAADLLLSHIEATIQARAFANLGKQVQVRTSAFGEDAGMIGAAALALDHFFYRQPTETDQHMVKR